MGECVRRRQHADFALGIDFPDALGIRRDQMIADKNDSLRLVHPDREGRDLIAIDFLDYRVPGGVSGTHHGDIEFTVESAANRLRALADIEGFDGRCFGCKRGD